MQKPQQSFSVASKHDSDISVKLFDQIDYLDAQQAMIDFTVNRQDDTVDQIWVLQHPPVYTKGTACAQTPLAATDIPVVQSDRGGQITYHGPGQIVMYPLLNIKRYEQSVRSLVSCLEQSVIDVLNHYQVRGERRENAPGVYVQDAKIAALGLRIKKGCCYHGLSFNINMDLQPFANIDPCGYQGLQVTHLSALIDQPDFTDVRNRLVQSFVAQL